MFEVLSRPVAPPPPKPPTWMGHQSLRELALEKAIFACVGRPIEQVLDAARQIEKFLMEKDQNE